MTSKDKTLADRLNELMAAKSITIRNIEEAVGITYEMARRYTKGTAEPRKDKLAKLAAYLGVTPQYLQFGDSTHPAKIESNVKETGTFDLWDRNTPLSDDEYEVPFYQDIRLAAGDGFADDAADYNGFKLRFSKSTLRRQGVQYENAVCVVADGNSMEPVIPSGTTVGVDMGNKTIRDGAMYAINHGGLLRVKILYNLPNHQVRIHSYNTAEHADEIADLADVIVIGKVFWYSVLL